MVLHGIAGYCMVLYGMAWYCMVLHGTAYNCTVLHITTCYYMVLLSNARKQQVLHVIGW